jgi:Anti-sigma-K factor rskA, C-terminal
MLSERDIELAHPDAFDFAFGNLPQDKRAEFNRHLSGCRYCQGVIDEYSDIGEIIKNLPPHVEPPADLEARTVAAMVAALAEQRASTDRRSDAEDQTATRVYQIPERPPSTEPETQVRPRPVDQPAPAEPKEPPAATPLPLWRRYPRRLAAVVAVAAAIVTAVIVIPRVGGGPAQVVVVIPLHTTTAAKVSGDGAATGRATAQQAGASWTFNLSVHGLKVLPGNQVYECWWAASGSTRLRPLLVSGGTFVVDNSGSATVTMTTGVDPRQFRTMEITAESPGSGALHGVVLLTGQTL